MTKINGLPPRGVPGHRHDCPCSTCEAARRIYKRYCNRRWEEQARQRGARGEEPEEHGRKGYRRNRCECDDCRKAHSTAVWQRVQERNTELRAKAKKHGQPWTADEITLIKSYDFTEGQLAELLGRTLNAIRTKRRELRQRGELGPPPRRSVTGAIRQRG